MKVDFKRAMLWMCGLGFVFMLLHCVGSYPDSVSVGAQVSLVKEDRFTMRYIVVSHRHQNIAAEGEGVVVAYNYQENKKCPLPEMVKSRIDEIEHGRVLGIQD